MPVFSKIRYGVLLPLLLWFLLSGSFFFSGSSGGSNVPDHQNNFIPVALNDYLVTSVNSPLQAFLQATDRNGDALRYSIVTNPNLGYLQYFNPNTGEFTYLSPTPGQDNFTFIASDYRSSSNIAIVTITINRTALAWEPTGETFAQPFQPSTAGSESELLALPTLLIPTGNWPMLRTGACGSVSMAGSPGRRWTSAVFTLAAAASP